MKQYNKQILEAINRGIRLAIDDFEDIDDSISSKSGIIQNDNNMPYLRWYGAQIKPITKKRG